ncbi:hypothetical protein QYF50_15415 [Paenibacillus vini]|uniref:hypothetical protein n=1 Tax=Paenibacillus vini TaxID=1476024 RepID=UPI0025B6F079|nr:hypothetical protein [Paenibacillus vini]MDN4069240.1 hypothetical protein [Paenibacillus vini]MDN4069293.1 hypothetical protein [Paenibacillus vini]
MSIQNVVTTKLYPEDLELIKFLFAYPQKDISWYEGKYHHLKFNWRPLLSETGLPSNAREFVYALNMLEAEGQREFIAQAIFSLLEGGRALEQLFIAAFGE